MHHGTVACGKLMNANDSNKMLCDQRYHFYSARFDPETTACVCYLEKINTLWFDQQLLKAMKQICQYGRDDKLILNLVSIPIYCL